MSYQDMKDDFVAILDRDDMTTAQADIFLRQGMSRIQRTCRLPSMERAQLITPTTFAMSEFPVPTDLIQIIDILVPLSGNSVGQMTSLKRLSYRRLMEQPSTATPFAYARGQTLIYLRGSIPIGTQLQFLYYGNFSSFASTTADNELSASFPDFGVYAALSYAGDHFEHPLTAQWEARYQSIKTEVQSLAIDLETEGGVQVIEPIYAYNEDC
ncbi:MAG: hypothetical protein V4457_12855 [Pseudomonadota bacterium]